MLDGEDDIEIVGEAGSGSAAVSAINAETPDLVFLDVQMPGLDGFGVLREITSEPRPFVIFVTAYDDYAVRAFDVHAIDYLLKPVAESRLRDAVRRAVGRLRNESRDTLSQEVARLVERLAVRPDATPNAERLAIKGDGRVNFVRIDEIDWVEADGDIVRIHAGRETHRIRETLGAIEAKLPASRFIRIHRSIIVNPLRVREIQPWFKGDYVLILNDGTKLRSGRTYRQAVQSLMP